MSQNLYPSFGIRRKNVIWRIFHNTGLQSGGYKLLEFSVDVDELMSEMEDEEMCGQPPFTSYIVIGCVAINIISLR